MVANNSAERIIYGTGQIVPPRRFPSAPKNSLNGLGGLYPCTVGDEQLFSVPD